MTDKDIWLHKVREDGLMLSEAPIEYRSDFDIVYDAVLENGQALEFASDDLKKNIDIVSIAVEQNGYAFLFADKELQDNLELATIAIETYPTAFRCASENLRANKKFITYAVEKTSKNLRYVADKAIMSDSNFIMLHIHNWEDAWSFINPKIMYDVQRVLVANAKAARAKETRSIFDENGNVIPYSSSDY